MSSSSKQPLLPTGVPGTLQLPRAPWGFFHPSNALTYLVAVVGILAIRGFQHGHVWQAGAGLAVASILDLFDGMFARRFQRTEAQKRFGTQIDSLSDAFAFGAVPVTLFAMDAADIMSGWWILPAAFYLECALTRLGYYNLQSEERGGFVGVPTTLMGLLFSLLLCFRLTPEITAVALVVAGIAMVAPIRIPRPKPAVFYCVVAVAVVLTLWHLANGLLPRAY